ncbi:hypothetical protein F441_02089 [Phytophthora nicotianae CJ01A1]|uniref:SP-RING-type domain-containing protein n=1 Tax=Phytophthora nicotianae CJ01A1 TaxID=1317063 RepID=W2XRH5_PHYNI|nr:hypothetical protein F441_02089 [Phytophthora nicotianae CJ01A1]
MQTPAQYRRPTQFLDLAEESKSVLLELGAILNQRYRNRGPSHQTQRSLQRKNEAVSRLDQFIIDQQRVCEREERAERENAEQRATIERLEKQLEDQRADFNQERARLQQQATSTLTAQADLNSSLNRVLPQLRGLLKAYDREQGQYSNLRQDMSTRIVTITDESCSNQSLTRQLNELRTAFDEERAQLLEQASDAVKTQQEISRKNLTERETALTCPISLDLFENPVLTTCCGKTFSSEALTQALKRNVQCPVCRAHRVLTHANRDMANLVELHRSERSLLGLPENAAANSTNTAPGADERSIETERPIATPSGLMTSAFRESQNRNSRSQRVQARAAVPHRQPSSTTAQSEADTLPSTALSSRGQRRGGRNSNSRRRRTSRTRSSSTPTATSHRSVSSTSTTPSSSGSASLLSAMQSLTRDWRSSNFAPLSSTTGSGATGNATTQAYGSTADAYSNPRYSTLDSYYQQRSLAQSSNPTRYGRAPTDDEFNFYPSAPMEYYGSDSDY